MKSSSTELYSLDTADSLRVARGPRLAPIEMLRAQLQRGFVLLRFRRGLETDFCRYLRLSGRFSRAILLAVAFTAMVVTPLIDTRWLGLPSELVTPSRWLQMGLMLPVVILMSVFCWRRPHARAIEPLMVTLFAGLVLGLLVQRSIDAQYGYDVPTEFVGVCIAGMFALARIRFWYMLPAALVAMGATIINEIWFVAAGANAYYHLFTTIILAAIAIAGGYSTEYFIRWTWLNATLLRYLSRQDSLTGLLNREALGRTMAHGQVHARREGLCYAIAMVDIDAFGAFNDHYGHQRGDAALKRVAGVLDARARRPQDVCGRYGGEEFAVLWMDGDAEQLCAMAETVRAAVENAHIAHATSPASRWVTVSIGLCHVDPHRHDVDLEAVLGKADQLLYRAKAQGRNAVRCAAYDAELPGEDDPEPAQRATG